MNIDLSGKTAVVTGGGAGIGRAIAEAYADAGARVVVAEIDAGRADDVRAALQAKGGDSLVSVTDVRNTQQVATLFEEVERRFGGLDILVNNVGDFLQIAKPFERYTDDDFEALYQTNLRSVFICSRAAIPLIRKGGKGGSIISVSSIEAFRGIPMTSVYGAFKHAITGFTRSVALEVAADGIRVNAIAPETTETPQVQVHALVAPEHQHHIPRWIPLGRFGQPSDAAGAALFLASDLSSWITGTSINLDGGALAAGGWYKDPNNLWTNVPVITGNGFNF